MCQTTAQLYTMPVIAESAQTCFLALLADTKMNIISNDSAVVMHWRKSTQICALTTSLLSCFSKCWCLTWVWVSKRLRMIYKMDSLDHILYVVHSQPSKDATVLFCITFHFHSSHFLRNCSVKLLLFKKEKQAAGKISKIWNV